MGEVSIDLRIPTFAKVSIYNWPSFIHFTLLFATTVLISAVLEYRQHVHMRVDIRADLRLLDAPFMQIHVNNL